MNNFTLCSCPTGSGEDFNALVELKPMVFDLTVICTGGWAIVRKIKELCEESLGFDDVPWFIYILWKGRRLYLVIKKLWKRFRK